MAKKNITEFEGRIGVHNGAARDHDVDDQLRAPHRSVWVVAVAGAERVKRQNEVNGQRDGGEYGLKTVGQEEGPWLVGTELKFKIWRYGQNFRLLGRLKISLFIQPGLLE